MLGWLLAPDAGGAVGFGLLAAACAPGGALAALWGPLVGGAVNVGLCLVMLTNSLALGESRDAFKIRHVTDETWCVRSR